MASGSEKPSSGEEESGLIVRLLYEVFTVPINLLLVLIIAFIVYKIFKSKTHVPTTMSVPDLPKMKKRDFTIEELREYDGVKNEGRILIAVNGKVFDVTKGRRFYGPGGPYASFAGKDASRGLATFSVAGSEEYDDLSDLGSVEMDSVREWEMQFTERYEYVGKLLKPGQEATSYSDEEEDGRWDETSTQNQSTKSAHPKED